MWRKDLVGQGHALLLLNSGAEAADITVRWGRDLPDPHPNPHPNPHPHPNPNPKPNPDQVRWARDLPDVARRWSKQMPRVPECLDDPEKPDCVHWAADGECTANPAFMEEVCRRSCGKCPPALYEGKQATALVRDVWEREYLGLYVALFTAKHVEPHEARQAPPAPPPLRIACPRSPPRLRYVKQCPAAASLASSHAGGPPPHATQARVITVRFEEPGMAQHRTLEKLVVEEEAERRRKKPSAAAAPVSASSEAVPPSGAADLDACVDEHAGKILVLILCVMMLMRCCDGSRNRAEVKSERHAV